MRRPAREKQTLGELRERAAMLRTEGKSYAEIGAIMSVTAVRARDLCQQQARHERDHPSLHYCMELSHRAILGLLGSSKAAQFGDDLESRFAHLPQIAASYSRRDLLAEDGVGKTTCDEIDTWLGSKGLSFQPPSPTVSEVLNERFSLQQVARRHKERVELAQRRLRQRYKQARTKKSAAPRHGPASLRVGNQDPSIH